MAPLQETLPKPRRRSAHLPFLSHRSFWIMGIVNATPDSFYAQSRGVGKAGFSLACRLAEEGADILDLGAESTRPGAHPVDFSDERRRLMTLVQKLRKERPGTPLSIDTQKARIAAEALSLGASMINDVSALRHDPAMAETVASARCSVVLMHMQGTPQTMQKAPVYRHVVDDVYSFLEERMNFAVRAGIQEKRIILDPGIGFGKTDRHNIDLLQALSRFRRLGRPLLLGVSRKGFIGRLLSKSSASAELDPDERLEGSLAIALSAQAQGVQGFRVHDVAATRRALKVWTQVERRKKEGTC